MNLRLLLITLLALSPAAAFGAPATVSPIASAEHLGLGVTRAELQEMFERPGLAFRFAKPDFECPTGYHRDWKAPDGMCAANAGSGSVRGRPRVIGTAGTQSLDLVGPADDIEKATLTLTFVPGEREQWVFNMLYAAGLMKEILGWEGSADWVSANLPKAAAGETVELRRGNRLVMLKGMRDLPVVFLTVEAVESPEAVAERQAAERRAAGERALDDGDRLKALGQMSAAITAWDTAARVPDTASEARSRQAHAWVQVAAELATSDTDGAISALDAAAKAAPSGEADRVEREAAAVRVSLARSLATSSPAVARTVLLASKTAQAADSQLFRSVTVAVASRSCSDSSLALYAEADELASLTPDEREHAGECALTLTSGDLDSGRVSAARQHFDAALRYAPNLDSARDVERSLKKAERKVQRGNGPGIRPVIGITSLIGAGALGVGSVASFVSAGAAETDVMAGAHTTTELDTLIADGQGAEVRGWLFAGGGLALGVVGLAVLPGNQHATNAERRGVPAFTVALVPGLSRQAISLTVEW